MNTANKITIMSLAEEAKEDTKELDHLKAQLAELNKSLAERDAEIKKIKDAEETAKLSAEEKKNKEIAEAKKVLAEKEAELVKSKQEAADLLLTAHLVAEYNLASPEFGPTILLKYDRKEKLDDFAKKMVKDPVYGRFFKSENSEQEIPKAPGTTHSKGGSRKSSEIITQADKDFAATTWRNDPAKQNAYLENLKRERTKTDE